MKTHQQYHKFYCKSRANLPNTRPTMRQGGGGSMGGRAPLGEQWKNADRYTLSRVHSIDSQPARNRSALYQYPSSICTPPRQGISDSIPSHPARSRHTPLIYNCPLFQWFLPQLPTLMHACLPDTPYTCPDWRIDREILLRLPIGVVVAE